MRKYFGTLTCFLVHKNTTKDLLSTPWIIDTDASDYIVCNTFLYNVVDCKISHFVILPNGEKVLATHIGSVRLTGKLILSNVLCVPSFSFNLVSTQKLSHDLHCCLTFLLNICFM